jgi:hypothetical protein
MFINKKVKDCCDDDELNFIVEDIKPRTYYVIEKKARRSNPVHRCIMATEFAGDDGYPEYAYLFNDSYEPESYKVKIKDMYYFKIISEIKEMREK